MVSAPLSLLVLLTLLWFVIFWIVGGVIFAIIGLVRFLRLNKNRFSCLFTLFSLVTAFFAARMGMTAAYATASRVCLAREGRQDPGIEKLLPNIFQCSSQDLIAAAGFWFLILLVGGIFIMFISRTPERPRDIHGNH